MGYVSCCTACRKLGLLGQAGTVHSKCKRSALARTLRELSALRSSYFRSRAYSLTVRWLIGIIDVVSARGTAGRGYGVYGKSEYAHVPNESDRSRECGVNKV